MDNNETIGKNYVITGLLISLVLLVIACLRLATISQLKTNRYGYDDIWDVAITNIKMVDIKGDATEVSKPTFSNKNASFDVQLKSTDSYIRYEITVKNRGTLDAVLKNYISIPEEDIKNIEYEFDESYKNSILKSGLESKYYITIKYIGENENDLVSSKTVVLEYAQKK